MLCASLWVIVASPGQANASNPVAPFSDSAVTTGLSQPIAVGFLPDQSMVVAEKNGEIVHVVGNTKTTLATIPVCTASEMGVLGIAIDPNFDSNGYIYLYRTDDSAGCGSSAGRYNQVVRVTMADNAISLGSLTVLLTGIQTDNGNHDGGVLRIGPDGKLYIGAGDSGLGDNVGPPGSATNPYAQDINSLNGKILRINLDGTIPASNPFVGNPGRDEIYAVGFRNPFRMGFDGPSGKLWVGDVGDLTIEEIDIVNSGGNYGWPRCEATSPAACELPGDIDPIFSYPHTGPGALGSTVIGGAAAPAGFGAYAGDYFFADFITGKLYHSTPTLLRDGLTGTPAVAVSGIGTFYGGPNDIVFGPDGALYYVQLNPGEVHKVTPPGFVEPIAGQTLTMTESSATKKTLNVLGKDSSISLGGGPGSSDDPTAGGGTVEVRTGVGETLVGTFPLASAGWSYTGPTTARNGLKFKALNNTDPITSVSVKKGKTLSVKGKGAGLSYSIATDPNPVTISLTTGTKTYCTTFGGTTKYTSPKKFTGKKSPRENDCP
jgi:glucose/arabinose dehydrogenase